MKARNEAIELTWLRSYSDLSPRCPTWVFLADELIRESLVSADSKTTCREARTNIFLQGWETSVHARSPYRTISNVC